MSTLNEWLDALPPERRRRVEARARDLIAEVGKFPGSHGSKTTKPVDEKPDAMPASDRVAVIRGVYVDLDREGRPISISIDPRKLEERRTLRSIVGIGSDPKPDVAERHDDYLAEQDPHGGA